MKLPKAFRFLEKKQPPTDNTILLRAERAYRLLQHEVFHEAVSDVENAIWESYFSTKGDEYTTREALYEHIKALQMIKAQLETFVRQGEIAKHIHTTKENGYK